MNKYHTDDDGKLLLDERGDPIPSYQCICLARDSFECCCGGWDVSLVEWREEYGET